MDTPFINTLLLRSSWRFFTRRPWQLWLTLLSIALGTAVIVAVDLANRSAGVSFQRSVNALAGSMTHEITAHRGLIPAEFYRQLRVDWGYRDSAPQVEVILERQGVQYRLLGIDPFASALQQSDAIDFPAELITQLLTKANTVLAAQGLEPDNNDTLNFLHHGREVTLQVLARLAIQDDLLLTDIATAQAIVAKPGLSRIQLKLEPQQVASLTARLPAQLKLTSFQQEQQVFTEMTRAFNTNLQAMSLLAILVGAFLVYNTMTFSVVQRRQTFAIERMLGVTGRQLFRRLLAEALLLGAIGSLLGLVLGIVLGQGLLLLVTRTINDLFIDVNTTDFLLSLSSLLQGVGITLLAVLLATLAPALEAARVQPVQVQRYSTLEQGSRRLGGGLLVAGGVLLLLSLLLLLLSGRSLLLGFIGLFLLILGYSLCVPQLLQAVFAALRRLQLQHTSLLWRMVVRGVQSSLSRTSLAIIALTVAVSATVGVSMMVESFRSSLQDWLAQTLSSDLYVSATPPGDSGTDRLLHPDWLPRLQQLPQVLSVSSARNIKPDIDGLPVATLVLEPGQHSVDGFEFLDGTDVNSGQIWPQFIAGKGILVSEPYAYHRHKQVGDVVEILTELNGKVQVPIIAVFRDYSAAQGMVTLAKSFYEQHWGKYRPASLGIKLKTGVEAETVLAQARTWADELQLPDQPLVIRSNQAIREQSLAIFDRTFAITHVLRILVIIVAFVGVFSVLMALFLERGREFGVLRAVGFTPQQLQVLVLGQTALIGVLAGLLALPLGWLMSEILIDIINRRSFGWTMQSYVFGGQFVQAVLLAVVAALLAGGYPVWRLSKLKVRESLYG